MTIKEGGTVIVLSRLYKEWVVVRLERTPNDQRIRMHGPDVVPFVAGSWVEETGS